jgi:uncharacterized membrane protein HdeD (DUF308 family)
MTMIFAEMIFDRETLKKYSTQTIVAGVLMLLVGMAGIFMPAVMSLVVVTFLGWLFLISAAVQGYITWKTYNRSFSAWLKPVLSLIAGVLLFVYPVEGVAAVAIMLSAYLLVDAFASFGFAMDYKPNKGWWLLIVNAVVSILLAVLILIGWPVSSLLWVGLYAAVSLFFDGVSLVAMGVGARKLVKEDQNK